MTSTGKEQLIEAINRARFYPELVLATVEEALIGAEPTASLVHLETHFDQGEVHRHITVLALAGNLLVVAHLDDQNLDETGNSVIAHVSVETLTVSQITNLTLNYTYPQPQNYTPGTAPNDIQLIINWTGSHRLDLAPADCPDPTCSADHGYTGIAPREDIVLRISATADGPETLHEAISFARALRAAHLKAHQA